MPGTSDIDRGVQTLDPTQQKAFSLSQLRTTVSKMEADEIDPHNQQAGST